jgi:hypothetical protein
MVLAPACLVDLGDVGAAVGVAAKTGDDTADTADAAITPAAPISTSRRDAEEFDACELVDMVLSMKECAAGLIHISEMKDLHCLHPIHWQSSLSPTRLVLQWTAVNL